MGNIIWTKILGGSDDERAAKVISTTDGGYLIIGSTKSKDGDVTINNGESDVWIVKMSNIGEIQWQKTYGGVGFETGVDVIEQNSGYYILASSSNVGTHGESDYWLLKINVSGQIEWNKFYGGSKSEVARSFSKSSDGGLVIIGDSESSDGDVPGNKGSIDLFILKVSADGSIVWKKDFGGNDEEAFNVIKVLNDDSFIVAGYTSSTVGDITGNHTTIDALICKFSKDGVLLWQKAYTGNDADYASSFSIYTNGDLLISGDYLSKDGDFAKNLGMNDLFLSKITFIDK